MKRPNLELINILAEQDYQKKLPHMRILVVDDNRSFLRFMQSALTKRKHHVQTTTDPFEIIRSFLEQKPDLVFLDVNMPGMNGYTLFQILNLLNTFGSELILMSANGVPWKKLEELQARFVSKPIDLRTLDKILEIGGEKSLAA